MSVKEAKDISFDKLSRLVTRGDDQRWHELLEGVKDLDDDRLHDRDHARAKGSYFALSNVGDGVDSLEDVYAVRSR